MNGRLHFMLLLYQYAAGFCDTATGLLLIAAPAFTLGVMGLAVIPQPVAFVRYIGVFVLSVGLTYFWAALRWPRPDWATQWKITTLIRSLVALFIVCQAATGAIEARWISVAFTDGAFALFQIIGLAKGWLELAS